MKKFVFNNSSNFYNFLKDYEKLFYISQKLNLEMNDILAKVLFTASDFETTMLKNKYLEIFNKYVVIVEEETEVNPDAETNEETTTGVFGTVTNNNDNDSE